MELNNNNETLPENINKSNNEILTEDDTNNPKYSEGKTNFIGAFLQIGNTILGAGIISLPVVMRYLGFILGILFIIIISFLTIYSSYLLLKAHQITGKKKYSTIAHASLGDIGYIYTNFMIILNNFGLCCLFFRIFGDTMQNIISGYVEKDNFFVTNWHNFFYIIILLIVMCFIIWTRDFEKFEKTSFLGMFGILIYVLTLLILFFYKISKGFKPHHSISSYLIDDDYFNILISLPSVFLSFSFQFNLFPIYSGLVKRTHHNMLKITISSILFCLVLYLFSSICGYLMYGNSLNDTILNAFLKDMQDQNTKSVIKILLIIANIGFLLCSTTSLPLVYFTLKQNIFATYKIILKKYSKKEKEKIIEMVKEEKKENKENKIIDNSSSDSDSESEKTSVDETNSQSKNDIVNDIKEDKKDNKEKIVMSSKTEIIISTILYIIIGIVTILIPELKTLFNIIGCTTANAIQFIIPSLMIIALEDKAKKLVNLLFVKLLLLFGILSLLISLISEIIHLVT